MKGAAVCMTVAERADLHNRTIKIWNEAQFGKYIEEKRKLQEALKEAKEWKGAAEDLASIIEKERSEDKRK